MICHLCRGTGKIRLIEDLRPKTITFVGKDSYYAMRKSIPCWTHTEGTVVNDNIDFGERIINCPCEVQE